jgi:type I restriction enzyme S subunit
MSFPRYERSKDSGPTWFGKVPTHWQIFDGRRVFSQKREASLLDDPQLSATQKYGVIPQALFMELEGQKVVLALKGTDAFKHVEKHDFIISLRSFQGGIEKSHYRGCVSTAYTVLRNAKTTDSRYWEYLFKCSTYIDALSSVTDGIREGRSISYAQFGGIPLPFPTMPEQSAIASFLDYETAKIDALIEEQRRLIELLKEKRQAVISHAVTKGLNPDARMWDTRIKWIGEIPASWTVTRVKYAVSNIVDCLHSTPTYEGELLYPAIRTADLEPGRLLLTQARLVSEEVYLERVQRLEPQAGDILYSREGERFGMAALVPSETKVCLGQRMMMFRPSQSFDPGYLMWALNSSALYQQVLERVTGPTAPHVNIGEVINFVVPAPKLIEQRQISKHIDTVVTRMDNLVARAQEGIGLLEERRSALISAAVTGKIDVRHYTPKEAA